MTSVTTDADPLAHPLAHPLDWALFDLDGCLIDSSRAIPACINVALEALGHPTRSAADLRWCIGPPLALSFATLLEQGGEDPTPVRVAAGVDAYRDVFPDLAPTLTTVVPGIVDLLTTVDQRRAVVTSKPTASAIPMVAAMDLDDFFEAVHGPDLDVEHEPKATTLARAMADLDVQPGAAVMVGDRHHDVDAGRHAGTATVGVTWGAGDRPELEAARADAVVDHPDELASWLADRRLPA